MRNLLIITLLLWFGSCKQEESPAPVTPDPVVPTGTFLFHLHTYLDLEEVDLYGITYSTAEGRSVSLDLAQMYLSDIQLVKADGSVYSVSGKCLLKTFEAHTYQVGEVPVGAYTSVRFRVGLPAAVNAQEPAASPDSLILNRPDMWWGSTAQPDGYVFLHVQGKIDTSADMSQPPVPFLYKIGTNSHHVQVSMGDNPFVVEAGNAVFSHIIVDYSQLFRGIDLRAAGNLSVATAGENNTALAQQIVANIPSMFRYE